MTLCTLSLSVSVTPFQASRSPVSHLSVTCGFDPTAHMDQQTFDASNILSKLRQNRPAQSPQDSHHFRPSSNHHSAQLPRNRFQRKERPEVRIELENEIEHLSGEVYRLKRENKQLQLEKENAEFRCSDIKEKADVIISKLRNQLAALQKKQEKVAATTPKDKYAAKKILQKSFGGGAGVLNITNSLPSTVPKVNPASSIQSLTFSQFMKRNSQDGGEEFNTSLRHYPHHQQQQQGESDYDPMHHDAAPPNSLPEDMTTISPYPQVTSFGLPHFSEEQAEELNFQHHHPELHSSSAAPPLHSTSRSSVSSMGEGGGCKGLIAGGSGSGTSKQQQPSAMRSKSIAPPTRTVDDIIQNNSNDFTQFLGNGDLADDHVLNKNTHSNLNAINDIRHDSNDYDDEGDLPIVEIDLRSDM